jgi:hypothetical protein
MRSSVGLGVGVIATVALAGILGHRLGHGRGRASAPPSSNEPNGDPEISRMRARIDALDASLGSHVVRPAIVRRETPNSPGRNNEPEALGQGALSDEEQTEAQLQLLDETMDLDTLDPPYERSAWVDIATTLESDPFRRSRLRSVSCTRSLCRILVDHLEEAEGEGFTTRFAREVGGRFGGGFADWQPGERGGSTIVYLARLGKRLPRLQQ